MILRNSKILISHVTEVLLLNVDTLTCNAASGNCRGTCGSSETDKGTCCNGQKCCVCQGKTFFKF